MTVISDTSPLNYLVLIDLQDVLPALFGHVLIPEAVRRELRSPAAPQPVKVFLDAWPSWLDCRYGGDGPALGPGINASGAPSLRATTAMERWIQSQASSGTWVSGR